MDEEIKLLDNKIQSLFKKITETAEKALNPENKKSYLAEVAFSQFLIAESSKKRLSKKRRLNRFAYLETVSDSCLVVPK